MTPDTLSSLLGAATLFALSVAVFAWASARVDSRVRWLAFASFALHSALGAAIWYAVPVFNGPDAKLYDGQAMAFANYLHGSGGGYVTFAGKEGFSTMLGGVYAIVGHMPMAGIVLNAFLMALFVLVAADASRRIAGRMASHHAAIMATALPPFVWWGSQLLREPAAWLLIAVVVDVAIICAKDGITIKRGVLLLVLIALLGPIRTPIAIIVAVAVAGGLLLTRPARRRGAARRLTWIAAGVVIILFLAPRYAGLDQLLDTDAAQVARSHNELVDEGSTNFSPTVSLTAQGLVGILPSTIVPVTIGPLPWQLSGDGVPALADTVSWWFVLVCSMVGIAQIRRTHPRVVWIMVLPAVGILLSLALTSGNFGTMIRIRAQVLVLLLPLAATGTAHLRARMAASVDRRRDLGHHERGRILSPS